MWTSLQYRRWVRGSAWYDLIVTAAFATPWSFAAMHGVLTSVSQTFNLPGALPPFEPMHMLMANLLGSVVCVWAVLRIRDPRQVYGRYDAVARFLFAAWQLYALLQGVSSLLVIFLFFELAFGVAQVLPVRTPSSERRPEQARSHRGTRSNVGPSLLGMGPEGIPQPRKP